MVDYGLAMSLQVSHICSIYNYTIRYCLTTELCKTLVHALVTSRSDYGNAVLYGIAEALMTKNQVVQNVAARQQNH